VRNPLRRHRSHGEATPGMTEQEVCQTLYGPQTRPRSEVTFIVPTVCIATDMVNFGLFRLVLPWTDWDRISWEDDRPRFNRAHAAFLYATLAIETLAVRHA
jgi:hypothetical protein